MGTEVFPQYAAALTSACSTLPPGMTPKLFPESPNIPWLSITATLTDIYRMLQPDALHSQLYTELSIKQTIYLEKFQNSEVVQSMLSD